MTTEEEHIKKVVAQAPPLSPEQKSAIARIFDVENQRALRRAERQPYKGRAPKGLTLRHFPGKPERSNGEVLQEYRARWDEGLERSPMYSMYNASPEDIFRWRVEFDCGCVEERVTQTDDPQSILDGSDRDYSPRESLPPGQYRCRGEHPERDLPLREIASWDERVGEEVLPADPIEPPTYIDDPDVWARLRRDEARVKAEWKATLSCGHTFRTLRDLDWTPDQGFTEATPERLAEMRAEWAEFFAPAPIDSHYAKMLDAGWPEHFYERDCRLCKFVRRPIAYEPLGWLVRPPRKPRKAHSPRERPRPATPSAVRLKTAEAAKYLGLAESTLRYWRHRNVGPKSYRIGRLTFWDVADLDAFIAAERRRTERG